MSEPKPPDKRKGQIRLSNFYDRLKKRADKVNKDYFSVGVDYNSKQGLTYMAYIDGYKWTTGQTMKEVFEKLDKQIDPPEKNREDVIIDKR